MDITVVDSPCGYGKSSWAIQYMNDNEDISFIYITPFLDEVKRIKEECTRRIFKEPIQNGNGKMENLLTLLSEGTNIATTHALFKNMDERCIQYLKNNEYVLIMDEVVDVVQEVDIKKDDIDMLIRDGKIKVLDDNRIIWIEENYDGSFNKYKLHLKNGDCYLFQNSIIMWTFPTKILKLFKHTYILTYLFEGSLQCNYYQMNDIKYEYKSVRKIEKEALGEPRPRYELCEFYIPKIGLELRNKIHIYEGKLNDIGKSKDKRINPLSKSWYEKKGKTNERCELIKNNMYNYFFNICKSKSQENMWVTFKDYKSKCGGKGFKGRDIKMADGSIKNTCFVPLNSRATNEFRHKKYLAYGINRFMSPILKNFFLSKGVEVDEEMYVLSEFIQWIWRSTIRDGNDIYIYIPSERMRSILNKYFDMMS